MPDENAARPKSPTQFFFGDGRDEPLASLPPPPRWRDNSDAARREQGEGFHLDRRPSSKTVAMINASLLLRRPLLVTGKPGTGKSTLARSVAERLGLGPVLEWSITTKTTLQSGLYQYDAIGRLNAASILRQELEVRALKQRKAEEESKANNRAETPPPSEAPGPDVTLEIGPFIHLGPLGTALACPLTRESDRATKLPRVLLIDEIDKADIDLPNDLLHVFENGEFEITELLRLADRPGYGRVSVGTHDFSTAEIKGGRVRCEAFPLVVMTSNGEREFPPAFLRRCLRLKMMPPSFDELKAIVKARLGVEVEAKTPVGALVERFLALRDGSATDPQTRELAVDQLLNAVYLLLSGAEVESILDEALFQTLTGAS